MSTPPMSTPTPTHPHWLVCVHCGISPMALSLPLSTLPTSPPLACVHVCCEISSMALSLLLLTPPTSSLLAYVHDHHETSPMVLSPPSLTMPTSIVHSSNVNTSPPQACVQVCIAISLTTLSPPLSTPSMSTSNANTLSLLAYACMLWDLFNGTKLFIINLTNVYHSLQHQHITPVGLCTCMPCYFPDSTKPTIIDPTNVYSNANMSSLLACVCIHPGISPTAPNPTLLTLPTSTSMPTCHPSWLIGMYSMGSTSYQVRKWPSNWSL